MPKGTRGGSKGGGAQGGGGGGAASAANKEIEKQSTGLPQLEGSEKQVAWAEDIRNGVYAELGNIVRATTVDSRNPKTGKITYHTMTEDRRQTLEEVSLVGNAITKTLKTITKASDIINNRDGLKQRSVKNLVENFVNAKKQARENNRKVSQDVYDKAVKKYIFPKL